MGRGPDNAPDQKREEISAEQTTSDPIFCILMINDNINSSRSSLLIRSSNSTQICEVPGDIKAGSYRKRPSPGLEIFISTIMGKLSLFYTREFHRPCKAASLRRFNFLLNLLEVLCKCCNSHGNYGYQLPSARAS
jgi:hypothetical protein